MSCRIEIPQRRSTIRRCIATFPNPVFNGSSVPPFSLGGKKKEKNIQKYKKKKKKDRKKKENRSRIHQTHFRITDPNFLLFFLFSLSFFLSVFLSPGSHRSSKFAVRKSSRAGGDGEGWFSRNRIELVAVATDALIGHIQMKTRRAR